MTGFEPATSASQMPRSTELSHIPIFTGVLGLEPEKRQSKCRVLPLHHTPRFDGEERIRTFEGEHPLNRLAICRNRPLCHLSIFDGGLPPITACSYKAHFYRTRLSFTCFSYNLISYKILFSYFLRLLFLTVCIIPYSKCLVNTFFKVFLIFLRFFIGCFRISQLYIL